MNKRSNRADVRNPITALPAFAGIQALDEPTRLALAGLLTELGKDARQRADKCWRTHKAPMAAYWKAVSVYSNHISRAIRRNN